MATTWFVLLKKNKEKELESDNGDVRLVESADAATLWLRLDARAELPETF